METRAWSRLMNAINIAINARDHASGAFARAGQAARTFGQSLLSLKGLLTTAIGGLALKATIEHALTAWGKQEQAEAKLAATLRATGEAAGLSAEQLRRYAAQLQTTTTYGDEAIINAQALLATFQRIKGETFERATKAILDLSAAMGSEDLTRTTIQLGKALNDPAKALSALTGLGITFTSTQKQEIEQSARLGDAAKAQALILAELEARFGGLAVTMGQTGTGAMRQFRNAAGDLWEALGKALTPAILLVADAVSQAMPYISSAFAALGNHISTACAYIQTALDGWRLHLEALQVYIRVFVDTVKREFSRLYRASIQDLSTNIAKYYIAARDLILNRPAADTAAAFKIIDQSYRDYFSPEALGQLTAGELTNLKTLEDSLDQLTRHYELKLPENLAQFAYQPTTPFAFSPQIEGPAETAVKAGKRELAATEARFLGRSPADDAARRAAEETRRNTASLVRLMTRHIDLAERQLAIAEDAATSDQEEMDL